MTDGIPNRPLYFYQKGIVEWVWPILGFDFIVSFTSQSQPGLGIDCRLGDVEDFLLQYLNRRHSRKRKAEWPVFQLKFNHV